MTSTREQLKEAYRLIRQDQPQEAEQLLRPILAAEPENVHAWWLLAYSVDDPHEVRNALNKVLEIDPDYSNAPKARDMLDALEEQFFSTGADDSEDSSFLEGDEFLSDVISPTGHDETALQSGYEIHGPGYDEDYSTVDESFFVESDSAGDDLDVSIFGDDRDASDDVAFFPEDSMDLDQDADELLFPSDTVEAGSAHVEDRAAAEERAGRRAGRRGCVRIAMLLVVLLAAVAVGAYLLMQNNQDEGDPGALVAAQDVSAELSSVVAATEQDIVSFVVGGQQKALVAESSLGDTLYVEFCGESSSDLSQDIALAMQVVAQHALNAPDTLDAIGVSVNRCNAATHDTLYRAFVPLADAVSYINGDFGPAQIGWAEFQRRWQES